MTYLDKLRDPRWQRRRLEVLQRHYWRCDTCERGEDDGIPLHVHHKFYHLNYDERGRLQKADPWNYQDEDFRVLCDACHQQTEIALMEVQKALGGFEHYDLAKLADELQKAMLVEHPKAVLDAIFWQLGTVQAEAAA